RGGSILSWPSWVNYTLASIAETTQAYVRPVKRIAVRCRKPDGTFAYGVLISALSAQHVLTLTGQSLSLLDDPAAVLLAYLRFYDQRGGGVETSFKDWASANAAKNALLRSLWS